MIRLLTVIADGIELLPHFIKHYQQYVDEINIAVYETDEHPLLGNEISELIGNDENIKIVKVIKNKAYDVDKATLLYNFIKSQKPNDWWVIANVNEFHLYPHDNLRYMVDNCEENGYQLVRGGVIDRIRPDNQFPEITKDQSIFDQYPTIGFFAHQMSKSNPNRVCVMRGHVELTPGQHYAKIDGETTWKWQGWDHPLISKTYTVQVHNFKLDIKTIDQVRKNKSKIDLNNPDFMIQTNGEIPKHRVYRKWDKLIKKITSI